MLVKGMFKGGLFYRLLERDGWVGEEVWFCLEGIVSLCIWCIGVNAKENFLREGAIYSQAQHGLS